GLQCLCRACRQEHSRCTERPDRLLRTVPGCAGHQGSAVCARARPGTEGFPVMSDVQYEALVATTVETLERVARDFAPAVFASSLAAEDMVLADLILRNKLPIGIFTLETGRLHAETLGMVERIRETYGYEVALYKPEAQAIDAYVRDHGLNAFYDSVDMRKECCRIRKVEPLNRALVGNKAWVTGQRRAQSATRT